MSEFCNLRQRNGIGIPDKLEIVCTLEEMATFGKRKGDTLDFCYVNDGVVNLNSDG